MLLIAHRGNFEGRNKDKENTVEYLRAAKENGFMVEIDVWFHGNEWYLGHDAPETKVDDSVLNEFKDVGFFHAKNLEALSNLLREGFNVFFHHGDQYTLTSKGYIWALGGAAVDRSTIAVMPEFHGFEVPARALGVCSDDLRKYIRQSWEDRDSN